MDIEREEHDVVIMGHILPHERLPNPDQIICLADSPNPIQFKSTLGSPVLNTFCNSNSSSSSCSKTSCIRDYMVSSSSSSSKKINSDPFVSECSICYEPYTSLGDKRCVVTPCGHLFCFGCLTQVFKGSTKYNPATCPKCRTEFKKNALKTMITLYDTDKIMVADPSMTLQLEDKVRSGNDRIAQLENELCESKNLSEKLKNECNSLILSKEHLLQDITSRSRIQTPSISCIIKVPITRSQHIFIPNCYCSYNHHHYYYYKYMHSLLIESVSGCNRPRSSGNSGSLGCIW